MNPVTLDGNLLLNELTRSILYNIDPSIILFNKDHTEPMYRGRGIIIKSFINSIMNTIHWMDKEGLSPTHLAILWDKKDKGEYIKGHLINALNDGVGYKGDRSITTDSDVREESDLDTKLKLEARLVCNNEFLEARKYLIDTLPTLGIFNFQFPGWEADDITYVWGLETECRNGKHIHSSGDSDWSTLLSKNSIHWQVNRGVLKKYTYDDVRSRMQVPEDMELLEYAEILGSALGTHNYIRRTLDPSIKRVTKKYKQKLLERDFSDITDVDRFEVQRSTFRIKEFPNIDRIRSAYDDMIQFREVNSRVNFKKVMSEVQVAESDAFRLSNRFNSLEDTLTRNKVNIQLN